MALIVIALLALVSVGIHSVRAESSSWNRHQAAVLASSLMDEAEVRLAEDFSVSVGAPRQEAPDSPEFQYQVGETLLAPGFKSVEVQVFWRQKHGNLDYVLRSQFVE